MRIALLALISVVLSGCAGYRIGPVQPTIMEGVTTIGVPTFVNDTLEPRIEVLITSTVIKQFQQDGTYRIASDEDSDVVLLGTIKDITRRRARSVRGNVAATREFELTLEIEYSVIDRVTGKLLFRQSADGRTTFFVGGDVQQDERQALGLASEEAAVQIVSQLSEGW